MIKKYELTDTTLEYKGHTLHRIKALVEIPGMVQVGELGGWVEYEYNLSHAGKCWVFDNAKVYDNAHVFGDAIVYNNASVHGSAWVCEHAEVYDNAEVYDHANISGNAQVCGDAVVYESANIFHNAAIYENSSVCGTALVYEMAAVFGNCCVSGDVYVCGNARLSDGKVQNTHDILVVGPLGRINEYATYNKTSGTVCAVFFNGTLDGFKKYVEKRPDEDTHCNKYAHFIAYVEAVLRDNDE